MQEHALRTPREQGYDTTAVERIAEAAEVSPGTFFRYLPGLTFPAAGCPL